MQELMTKLDTILLRCKAIGITLSIKKFKISKEVELHLLDMLSSRGQSGRALRELSPSKSF
jgi:uncharacterized protein Yka (UPF0111/DUF47 family)